MVCRSHKSQGRGDTDDERRRKEKGPTVLRRICVNNERRNRGRLTALSLSLLGVGEGRTMRGTPPLPPSCFPSQASPCAIFLPCESPQLAGGAGVEVVCQKLSSMEIGAEPRDKLDLDCIRYRLDSARTGDACNSFSICGGLTGWAQGSLVVHNMYQMRANGWTFGLLSARGTATHLRGASRWPMGGRAGRPGRVVQ